MSGAETNIKGEIVSAAIAYRRDGESLALLEDAVDKLLSLNSRRMEITKHAVERFRTRSGKKNQSLDVAERKIENMLDSASEVELLPGRAVMKILNHGFTEARYLRCSDWIFVVCNNCVVTCYKTKDGIFT